MTYDYPCTHRCKAFDEDPGDDRHAGAYTPPLAPWQKCRDIAIVLTSLGSLIWALGFGEWIGFEAWVPVGQVQTIRYFGTLGVKAQVDTTSRSFVVGGITEMRPGQEVVLHVSRFGSELCTADHNRCEPLMGHPQ